MGEGWVGWEGRSLSCPVDRAGETQGRDVVFITPGVTHEAISKHNY